MATVYGYSTFVTDKKYNNGINVVKIKIQPLTVYNLKNEIHKEFIHKQRVKNKIKKYNENLNKQFMDYVFNGCKDISLFKLKYHLSNVPIEYLFSQKRLLDSLRRSVNRTREQLADLVLSNDFEYFLTVTFDGKKVDRYNDKVTRKKMQYWLNDLKKLYKDIKYIAVAEYHKKGALHFHCLLGGVTDKELGLIDSGKRVKKGLTKGEIIYNTRRWKFGWSTVTKIKNKDACKRYILKYVTKQNTDLRFFVKKRYWYSLNCEKPLIQKSQLAPMPLAELPNTFDFDKFAVQYLSEKRQYCVLTNDKTKNL